MGKASGPMCSGNLPRDINTHTRQNFVLYRHGLHVRVCVPFNCSKLSNQTKILHCRLMLSRPYKHFPSLTATASRDSLKYLTMMVGGGGGGGSSPSSASSSASTASPSSRLTKMARQVFSGGGNNSKSGQYDTDKRRGHTIKRANFLYPA